MDKGLGKIQKHTLIAKIAWFADAVDLHTIISEKEGRSEKAIEYEKECDRRLSEIVDYVDGMMKRRK